MDDATKPFEDLRFSIEKSLRYHQRRRAFFETTHRSLMFLIIIVGSAGAASMFGTSAWLAFFAALIGAIDLVWGPGSSARDHLILHQRFSALMAEMVRTVSPEPAKIAEWKSKRVEIETDEPPIYWALDKDCYNEVCHALGKDKDVSKLYRLSWSERTFMNFFRFDRVTT